MRIWVLCLLYGLAALGCARPPRGSTPASDPQRPPAATPTETEASGYRVDQEGTLPPAPDVEFEEDKLEPPENVPGEGFEVGGSAVGQDLPRPAAPAKIEPTQTVPVPARDPNAPSSAMTSKGFRVQLAALANPAEAESARREAASRLGVEVYSVHEASLYKIRAGDFLDRAQAVALQTRARGYGYAEAWVVSTEIQVRRP